MMNRIWKSVGAMLAAMSGVVHAQQLEAGSPLPTEWAQYVENARKADSIVDPEARCLELPDLPGHQWREGAAAARCSLLREPRWSLDQVEALLASDRGTAELGSGFATLLDAHYKDQPQREQIFRAYEVFDDASPRAGAIATRWLERAPESAFAHAALGMHHSAVGWEARGADLVARTPRAMLDRMGEAFARAVPLLMQALAIEPRLSPACVKLSAIGRHSSDPLQRQAMAACTKVDRDGYYVALERIFQGQPKWGGSDQELRAAVAYAAARVDRNPILLALMGEHAGYVPPGDDDEPGAILARLVAASAMAPSGTLMAMAGRRYADHQDYWASLVYLTQALRFWPDDARYRRDRAWALFQLKEYAWAERDLKGAMALEPDYLYAAYLRGLVQLQFYGPVAARPYFERAKADPKWGLAASRSHCKTFMAVEVDEAAMECTRRLVEDHPTDAESWYMRVQVLGSRHGASPDALLAVDRFLQHADFADPGQQAAVEQARQWKSEIEAAIATGGMRH